MTLGSQYDWTAKQYPIDEAQSLPSAISTFFNALFPNVKPEAAIMNIYNPGDHLGMHRDVSEECDNPLISISLGCDGLFMVNLHDEGHSEPTVLVLRLHSGDVLYLSGPARFAWHGVPQIIGNTCPCWLCDWPAVENFNETDANRFREWRGWIANKRVNLSVRQIKSDGV